MGLFTKTPHEIIADYERKLISLKNYVELEFHVKLEREPLIRKLLVLAKNEAIAVDRSRQMKNKILEINNLRDFLQHNSQLEFFYRKEKERSEEIKNIAAAKRHTGYMSREVEYQKSKKRHIL